MVGRNSECNDKRRKEQKYKKKLIKRKKVKSNGMNYPNLDSIGWMECDTWDNWPRICKNMLRTNKLS